MNPDDQKLLLHSGSWKTDSGAETEREIGATARPTKCVGLSPNELHKQDDEPKQTQGRADGVEPCPLSEQYEGCVILRW
jgi:hypothetical protein